MVEEAGKYGHKADGTDAPTEIRRLQATLAIQLFTFTQMRAYFRLLTKALRKINVQHGTHFSHPLVVEDLEYHKAAEQMAETSPLSPKRVNLPTGDLPCNADTRLPLMPFSGNEKLLLYRRPELNSVLPEKSR